MPPDDATPAGDDRCFYCPSVGGSQRPPAYANCTVPSNLNIKFSAQLNVDACDTMYRCLMPFSATIPTIFIANMVVWATVLLAWRRRLQRTPLTEITTLQHHLTPRIVVHAAYAVFQCLALYIAPHLPFHQQLDHLKFVDIAWHACIIWLRSDLLLVLVAGWRTTRIALTDPERVGVGVFTLAMAECLAGLAGRGSGADHLYARVHRHVRNPVPVLHCTWEVPPD